MSIALHTSDAAVMVALHARDDVMDGDTQGLFPTDDDLWVLLEREKAPHDCCYDKVRFLITLYEGALALKFSIFVVAEPNDSVFMDFFFQTDINTVRYTAQTVKGRRRPQNL